MMSETRALPLTQATLSKLKPSPAQGTERLAAEAVCPYAAGRQAGWPHTLLRPVKENMPRWLMT